MNEWTRFWVVFLNTPVRNIEDCQSMWQTCEMLGLNLAYLVNIICI